MGNTVDSTVGCTAACDSRGGSRSRFPSPPALAVNITPALPALSKTLLRCVSVAPIPVCGNVAPGTANFLQGSPKSFIIVIIALCGHNTPSHTIHSRLLCFPSLRPLRSNATWAHNLLCIHSRQCAEIGRSHMRVILFCRGCHANLHERALQTP